MAGLSPEQFERTLDRFLGILPKLLRWTCGYGGDASPFRGQVDSPPQERSHCWPMAMALPASRIVDGRYVLYETLGQGGMGTVYRAQHRLTGQIVALKIIRRQEERKQSRGRDSRITIQPHLALAREFQTLASLHHPNIVQVIDYGFTEEFGPYFTMELLDHSQTLLEAAAVRPIAGRVQLLAQLLRALDYLHRRGIVHRDLKPSNVLCVQDAVKVVDFGLATSKTRAREVAGTLDYIAPEILLGAPASVQSDLYSFGVIMRRVVSPALPERMVTPDATTRGSLTSSVPFAPQPTTQPPADDAVDGPLRSVVRHLLATEPSGRPSSAVEVLHDLSQSLGEALPVETIATRESFLRSASFVGRDTELSVLSAALESARQGRGSAWLLGGESGAGKSRLLSELRTLALVQQTIVAQGQAVSEGGNWYHIWLPVLGTLCLGVSVPEAVAAVLKPLVPELPRLVDHAIPDAPPLPAVSARERLFQSVEALFRQQTRPTVVLLEDLQWADADSRSLLSSLCKLAADLPLLIIGTYRDDEAPSLPESAPTAHVLKLHRLARQHIGRLGVSMLGRPGDRPELVDYLYRQTEGNVFFLVEILRELSSRAGQLDRISDLALPEHLLTGGIEQFAARRIDQVPSGDRALLELAATYGRQIDLAVLSQAAPNSDLDAWLLSCSGASLIERRVSDWFFAHDKLREVILAHIAPEARADLHGRLAAAVEAVYPAGPARDGKSMVLAFHYDKAGRPDKAWMYNVRAGDIATRVCSYVEARRFYAAGLESLAALGDSRENRRRAIDTLLKQVHTSLATDTAEDNFARMKTAMSALEAIRDGGTLEHEDALRLARVNSVIGRIHYYRGEAREALDYYRKVLPVAEASGDAELAALPACMIGNAMAIQGRMREAEPLLAQAIEPLERLGEPFEWFRAVGYHGLCLIGLGQYADGVAELERVLTRAAEIGQATLLSASHLMSGCTYLVSGDWPLVIRYLEKVVGFAAQTGDNLHLSLAWNGMAWAWSCLGQHKDAEACRARGEAIAQAMGGRLILTDWFQAADAEIALNAGHLDDALRKAAEVSARSSAADLLFSYGVAERVMGEARARQSESRSADEHMARSIDVFEQGGVFLQAARSRLWWALQQRTRGEHASAQALFDQAAGTFRTAGCTFALSDAERMWAPSE